MVLLEHLIGRCIHFLIELLSISVQAWKKDIHWALETVM